MNELENTIIFPEKLTLNNFYNIILPRIYSAIIKKEKVIDFDLSNTILASPGGIINLLASASLIRKRTNYIPFIHIPDNRNLYDYLDKVDFWVISQIPYCEVLRFNKHYPTIKIDYKKRLMNMTPIYPILRHSTLRNFRIRASEIFQILLRALNITEKDQELLFKLDNIRTTFEHLLENIHEHAFENVQYKNKFNIAGYCMAQITPYNTCEIVISDIGIGFKKRILQQISDFEKNPNELNKRVRFYRPFKKYLEDKSYLMKNISTNPNFLAIKLGVRFRKKQHTPGLCQIVQMALDREGQVSIHSGNITAYYNKNIKNVKYRFHKNYFSGVHIFLTFPIKKEL